MAYFNAALLRFGVALACAILAFASSVQAQADRYDPMRSNYELWAVPTDDTVIETYAYTYQEDTGRKITSTGAAIINTRLMIQDAGTPRDFGYFARVQGSFDDWLGPRNPEVSIAAFGPELQDFFGPNGLNWNILSTYSFWNYKRGMREPVYELLAFSAFSGTKLTLCDLRESSSDSPKVRLFAAVKSGCRLYQQVDMLDAFLAVKSVIDAIEHFSRRQGEFGFIADTIGFADGKITVTSLQRPKRTRADAVVLSGWEHHSHITRNPNAHLGPQITCELDARSLSQLSGMGRGSLIQVSVKLKEIAGNRFVFECS